MKFTGLRHAEAEVKQHAVPARGDVACGKEVALPEPAALTVAYTAAVASEPVACTAVPETDPSHGRAAGPSAATLTDSSHSISASLQDTADQAGHSQETTVLDNTEQDNPAREGLGQEQGLADELAEELAALHVGQAETSLPVVPDLAYIAKLIKTGRARKIICMCGAGISVSAGIPDFRSPGTGLYSQLEKYKLPMPEAVFEINFFQNNPAPFYMLAKELWPGNYSPTPTHFFMRLLHERGLLLRCYTQNIDSLETQAGLPKDAVIAAHGNFDGAHCTRCRRQHAVEAVREAALSGIPLQCSYLGGACRGYVKPSIVFFGESLPDRFHEMVPLDFSNADLLIVMGTSLVVRPFASLIDLVADDIPRLLINRELVGVRTAGSSSGFELSNNSRDKLYLGDCDDGIWQLAELLGWKEQLHELIDSWGKA